ncbi:hypothetical protein ACPDHL_13195 [Myroides sp. C15-4]|uniref:hypothetical protein n=1 Tax=Myroides sp. C15-4 TaxID=3400532 RepID=UPI003D2F6D55
MNIIVWQVFIIGIILLMIYSLYRVGQSSYSTNKKILFFFMVLFFPLFGSLAFLMMNHNKEK